jgi:hypothetical protein
LAALDGHNVLVEYLNVSVLSACLDPGRMATDPVERLGDDAVINAAALALAKVRDPQVLSLLRELAKRASLTGVIGALGSFGQVESIPLLINALEDDASRPTAEAALKKVGQAARSALIASANLRSPSQEHESVSSLRRRRSVLTLLNEIGILREMWPELRRLMSDGDARISTLACKIGMLHAHPEEKYDVLRHLIDLSADADWIVRDDVEECLADYFGNMRSEEGRGRGSAWYLRRKS